MRLFLIEPVHRQENSGLIRTSQRTKNPWKGLQKQIKENKSLTLKLCQKIFLVFMIFIIQKFLMILQKMRSCL